MALEFCMNLIVIACMAIFPTHANGIMIGVLAYSLLRSRTSSLSSASFPPNIVAESEGHSEFYHGSQPGVWFAGIAGMCVYLAGATSNLIS